MIVFFTVSCQPGLDFADCSCPHGVCVSGVALHLVLILQICAVHLLMTFQIGPVHLVLIFHLLSPPVFGLCSYAHLVLVCYKLSCQPGVGLSDSACTPCVLCFAFFLYTCCWTLPCLCPPGLGLSNASCQPGVDVSSLPCPPCAGLSYLCCPPCVDVLDLSCPQGIGFSDLCCPPAAGCWPVPVHLVFIFHIGPVYLVLIFQISLGHLVTEFLLFVNATLCLLFRLFMST